MRNHHRKLIGDRFSEGARLLWQELARRNLSHAGAAKALGWERATISRVLYGDVVPGIGLLADVKKVFGIAPEAWAESPTVEFVPPALREAEEGVGAA